MPPNALRPSFTPAPSLLLISRSSSPSISRQTLLAPLQQRPTPHNHQQTRHATYIRRPQRPYTFTQLLTLSDGSTFLHRTSSPAPIYKSTKDTRNTALWNPSSQKLATVEEDEAGRLRAFRRRFGRGWDAETRPEAFEARDKELLGAGEGDGFDDAETVAIGGARDSALEAESMVAPGSGGENGRREILTGQGKRGRDEAAKAGKAEREEQPERDNMMDLISTFGSGEAQKDVERVMAGGQLRKTGKAGGKR